MPDARIWNLVSGIWYLASRSNPSLGDFERVRNADDLPPLIL